MQNPIPQDVLELLQAHDGPGRDAAWASFVASYTPFLLHAIRSVVSDGDETMDAYAWVLERLREDESRRLRGFVSGGQGRFTTWLVVVARRMSVDWLRHCQGRTPKGPGPDPADDGHALRRRLRTLAGEPVLLDSLRDGNAGPDDMLESAETHRRLLAAIRQLPPGDQLLISLRFEDDLNATAIARAMRLQTPFHVYRRLNRVLRTLRNLLDGPGSDGNE